MRWWAREAQRYLLGPIRTAAALSGLLALACDPAPAPPGPAAAAAPERERPVVLFLGDSLTAGFGLPAEQAFPALIGQRIDEAGLDYRVVNAGVSGDSSAGGRRRIRWLLRQPVAVLVLELGANDMLRGQDLDAMGRNLRAIIDETRRAHPEVRVVVAGMRAPVNLGRRYAEDFEQSFKDLAQETGAAWIPFLLEGVAARPELNQADRIHPNAEGHRKIAETVWQALRPLLGAS